jgi:hypothetical protein
VDEVFGTHRVPRPDATGRDGFNTTYERDVAVAVAVEGASQGQEVVDQGVKDCNGVLVIAFSGDVRRLFDPRPDYKATPTCVSAAAGAQHPRPAIAHIRAS